MSDYQILYMFVLVPIMFVAGMWLMIRGVRRYGFHPLTLIVPFFGAVFAFPIYFALRENDLRKSNAPEAETRRARKLMIWSVVFVGALMVASFVAGVGTMLEAMSGFPFDGPEDAVIDEQMKQAFADTVVSKMPVRMFWSIAAVCAAYAAVVLTIGRKKK